jgi:hypothetical protein
MRCFACGFTAITSLKISLVCAVPDPVLQPPRVKRASCTVGPSSEFPAGMPQHGLSNASTRMGALSSLRQVAAVSRAIAQSVRRTASDPDLETFPQ